MINISKNLQEKTKLVNKFHGYIWKIAIVINTHFVADAFDISALYTNQ